VSTAFWQINRKGEIMEKRRLIVVELTEEEIKNFDTRRSELIVDRRRGKIPVSGNEVDIDEWKRAFSIAEPYVADVMSIFYFYEDGKDFMRVN
jgi:hypothetical protein